MSSPGGEVSEQIVRDGMIVMEEAAKLLGLGAKNLMLLLIASAQREGKSEGLASLHHLTQYAQKTGQTVQVLPIEKGDVGKFKQYAKEFGLLYHPACVALKESEYANVLFLSGDAAKMNAIYEKFGYAWTADDLEKNAQTRAPSEKNLNERGSGSTPQNLNKGDGEAPAGGGGQKSVVDQMRELKAKAAASRSGQAPKVPAPKTPVK